MMPRNGRRHSRWVVGLCVLALAAAGCGGGGKDDDGAARSNQGGGTPAAGTQKSGTLRVAYEFATDDWTPGGDFGQGAYFVAYEPLVGSDLDNPTKLKPGLATEWDVTDKAVTFKLRRGVTFHDGEPFNAEAVKANVEFQQKTKGALSAVYDAVESVEVVDDLTVKMNLSRPQPSLPQSLADRAGAMASPKALADGSIKRRPVGTGPWAYNADESVEGTRFVFDYYDGYYDPAKTSTKRVELVVIEDAKARLSAVQTGEADIADLDPYAPSQAKRLGLETVKYPGLQYSLMLFDRGPGGQLEDLETRKQVCAGLDGKGFAAIGEGNLFTPSTQHFAEGLYGHNPAIKGYEFAPESVTVRPKLSLAVFDGNRTLGEAFAGSLERAGIKLRVEQVPAGDYFSGWANGKYPVGLGDNTSLHPYEWYATWFAKNGPLNPSKVESDELKAAADKAIGATDAAEQEKDWQEVMKVISDEALTCGHLEVAQFLAYKADRVSNVKAHSYWPSYVDYAGVKVAGN
jgi:peptide/nickel transport system substrate-binding protein